MHPRANAHAAPAMCVALADGSSRTIGAEISLATSGGLGGGEYWALTGLKEPALVLPPSSCK